jgi:hypothetical protein
MSLIIAFIIATAYFNMNCSAGKGFGAVRKKSFPYTGRLRPGEPAPPLVVPGDIRRPDYASNGVPKLGANPGNPWDITPTPPEDVPRMRVAGRIAREVRY